MEYFRSVKARVSLPPPDPEYVRQLRALGHKVRPFVPPPPAFEVFATEEEKEAHRLKQLAAKGQDPALDNAALKQELTEAKAIMLQQQSTIDRLARQMERFFELQGVKVDEAPVAVAAAAEPAAESAPVPVVMVDDDEPSDPQGVITTAKLHGRGRRRQK